MSTSSLFTSFSSGFSGSEDLLIGSDSSTSSSSWIIVIFEFEGEVESPTEPISETFSSPTPEFEAFTILFTISGNSFAGFLFVFLLVVFLTGAGVVTANVLKESIRESN